MEPDRVTQSSGASKPGPSQDSRADATPDSTVPSNKKIQLERKLGIWNGCAIIVGVIVGSGIFVSPKGVLLQAGSLGSSLMVWAVCGVLSLLGALCMAELGTSIPDSGGDYSYIKLAYGPLVSFLYLWVTMLIILPASNAVAALTFANYVMQPFYDNCSPPHQTIRLLAFAIVLILVWINCRSVDLSIRLQDAFTLTKVVALLLIISIGLYYIVAGKTDKISSDKIWAGEAMSLMGLGGAFYQGLYSYAGWNSLNFVTEEIKNPVKNMPRAIILSITLVTGIYVLANIAYFVVLSTDQISSSDAIAVTFGKETLGYASFIMPLSVALSTTSGLNALIFSSSRILFVGARQGQLFSLLEMISAQNLTPVPSLLIVGLMSCLYLITTQIASLIDYLVFIEASFGALAVSTSLVLRYKMPDLERPLKVQTWIPIVYLVVSIFLIALPIYKNPWEATLGSAILVSGIPIYYLTVNWRSKPAAYRKGVYKLTAFAQKLTMSVRPDRDLNK